MESAEALKRKIHVTQELKSIARTMKSLAAVGMHQSERALHGLEQYCRTVELGLQMALQDWSIPTEPPRAAGTSTIGGIVFGSDQGLCGQFNDRIASHAATALRERLPRPGQPVLLAVGERVVAPLQDAGLRVEHVLHVPGSPGSATRLVQELLLQVDQWRSGRRLGGIWLFHNTPMAGATFTPTSQLLVPVDLASIQARAQPAHSRTLPTFTMPAFDLLAALVREHIFASIHGALLRSLHAESSSRFAAMQAAERNIEEAFRELRGEFHQQRQSAVTSELLEIAAGFEALAGAGSR